jgi:hypothetical protein
MEKAKRYQILLKNMFFFNYPYIYYKGRDEKRHSIIHINRDRFLGRR